jgi:hypothetical protein
MMIYVFIGLGIFIILNRVQANKSEHAYLANKLFNDFDLEGYFRNLSTNLEEVRSSAVKSGCSTFQSEVVSHLTTRSYSKKLKEVISLRSDNDHIELSECFPEAAEHFETIAREIIASLQTKKFQTVSSSEVSSRRRRR